MQPGSILELQKNETAYFHEISAADVTIVQFKTKGLQVILTCVIQDQFRYMDLKTKHEHTV